jgi:transcription-repair coupling factor (superfamily II helicase)
VTACGKGGRAVRSGDLATELQEKSGFVRERHLGVCPPAQGAVLATLVRAAVAPVWLVIVENARQATALAEDLALFAGAGVTEPAAAAPEILFFPDSQADSRDMREAFAASAARLAVLSRLRAIRSHSAGCTPQSTILLTTPAALLAAVPAPEELAAREFTLVRGQAQPFAALLEKLRELDYDSEPVCESPGHYAVRGGIVDVYPVTAARPCRLDYFGDEIESIREFDPITQRSGAVVASVTLAAAPGMRFAASAGLADHLPSGARLALIEPAALDAEFTALGQETRAALAPLLARGVAVVGMGDLDEEVTLFNGVDGTMWDTESLSHHHRYPADALIAQERLDFEEQARGEFLPKLAAWRQEGHAVAVVTSGEGEERRAKEILAAAPALKGLRAQFLRGALNEGFRIARCRTGPAAMPDGQEAARAAHFGGGLVVVTETEIFGRQRPRRALAAKAAAAAPRAQVDQLLDFSELAEGDFVVHLQHGVAHYRGLRKLEATDGTREVVSLEFDGGVTLHVPLTESHLVSRYVGLGRARPPLGRVGSGRWEKTRAAAERATLDLAADLLRTQAAREAEPGHALPPDTDWQREFESAFPFSETPDQLRAIAETKADQERERPMDRLICGDVGFGKTEVAIRAAFKAVQAGRQVAVLVPTTVLAQQHLNTFRERMAGWPVAVELLSRFRTPREQKKILAAAGAGQVDILVGTHRLLGRDVVFRDLGLVIVDEEQRFGVRHKEALKRLRATVDLLSLSATPIPRTLYLALTGARDLSVIETPPADRHAIQTIVKTYDEAVVVDAVRHELRRGGQVFYLHNRVVTIEAVAARLRELVPGLGVAVGHGQMDAGELERVMTEFVAGKSQVLVCTTIIESGLDIPNCNTLIIEGADRFGLSQLYQLRGRVGRFNHQAYAYLLLHRHGRLLDPARQRLAALRAHSTPGAGFRIAMRDLELRGAGNLLGSEQSGHIIGVGFDLYCQLLRQSVARLKGEKNAAAVRATVKLDFVIVGEAEPKDGTRALDALTQPHDQSTPGRRAPLQPAMHGRHEDGYTALRDAEHAGAVPVSRIAARLPPSYVAEMRLRLDLYRRLALAGSLPVLKELEAELRDRFGKFGDEVRALLLLTEIRLRAEQAGLASVVTEGPRLKCLRAYGRRDDWVQPGARFPRLTAPRPLLRLREILAFLTHLPPAA